MAAAVRATCRSAMIIQCSMRDRIQSLNDSDGQCVIRRQDLEDVSQGEARERCWRVADGWVT